ncbi:MAG: response regulator transcription factor [Caldilineaceae bacterium]|nr:response regulator transcription factor [Caldilineaceae bacterium]
MMTNITLLIVEDHALVRRGLRHVCEKLGGFKVVGEAADGTAAIELATTLQPDVILMDIVMPKFDGLYAIRQILHAEPMARIIVLTMYRQEHYVVSAIKSGARAYMTKHANFEELFAAIRAVADGQYLIDPTIATKILSELHLTESIMENANDVQSLTESEMAVLQLVAQGVENQEIAKQLRLSVHTVANRLRAIYSKLHVTNRTQAALYALRHGWASLEDSSSSEWSTSPSTTKISRFDYEIR